jgi:hypothetical protein
MSDLEGILTLEYHKNRYTVATLKSSNVIVPILLDREIYKTVRKLNKKWYINDKNHVYCIHSGREGSSYAVYLHEVVIKLSKNADMNTIRKRPIIHINNIHFDNRIENLQFDTPNKDHSKNMKKKSRIIDLSEHGIDVDNLPTYMWYLKPDTSHGDRFTIEIPGQIQWRSTASKKVSLKYKLEESKKYLRHIKQTRPDIFDSYSMNGDMTTMGVRLYKEYNIMIRKAGFTMDDIPNNNTDEFLKQSTSELSAFEIYLLRNFEPSKGSIDVNKEYRDYQTIMDL